MTKSDLYEQKLCERKHKDCFNKENKTKSANIKIFKININLYLKYFLFFYNLQSVLKAVI